MQGIEHHEAVPWRFDLKPSTPRNLAASIRQKLLNIAMQAV